MMTTGVLHFVVPEPYVRIIPRFLREDWARPLVYASGVAEVAGGLFLVPARSRRPAAWFLVGLLVLVFPANVQMALDSPNPFTLARLPLQAPLIWWAWRQAR
ncbi:MAG: DoxX family protein [Actinobacteria bacterium]|nr:DoxX family protein [Actinomycetota bacterium]